jgi:PTS system N-acetylgalactosamine-specific IIA component
MNDNAGGGPDKARAVVVGHGEFAAGLVSAVGQICGMADKLVVLSMMGMTPEDIEGTIRGHLARTGARVIFTDLPAGNATIAARRIVRMIRHCVVSGVNLATLLDFVFSTDVSPTRLHVRPLNEKSR